MGIFKGMRRSLAAFGIVAVLGVLSMGALGAALYYAGYPLLMPLYGKLDDWHGDWVWPATMAAGSAWSLSFLAAGALHLRLERSQLSSAARRAVYAATLWIGAVAAWIVVGAFQPA